MPETRPVSEHELSDVDKQIINLDAQGKTKTRKFNKLWKKKDESAETPEKPEEIVH
ncbi:MAG: hypothetical protein HY545_01310 [Candidatus Doudnabacteria bacterium]|nr:hypothetical protein [Candidatus Doudnabacteria bacterium]